jgi:transposase-like protein
MALNKKDRYPIKRKIAAVEDYLKSCLPMRVIARRHDISHSILWHWIKRHQNRGPEGLKKQKFQTRRIPHELEVSVMRLKELRPGISVRKARIELNKSGVKISIYGIWRIWKEYGLIKNKRDDPLDTFIPATSDLERTMGEVLKHIEKKAYK